MAFHEVRFPDNISRGARGGPQRRTQIVTLASGEEERNAGWADSRRIYDASYGVRRVDDLAAVVAFFEARNGRLHGFRWKDWADYKSCAPSRAPAPTDQVLGVGDGVSTTFQLRKEYASGEQSYWRTVRKPVADTVLIAVNGEPLPAGAYSVDVTTGMVTLELSKGSHPPGTEVMALDFTADMYSALGFIEDAPPAGAVVTAGFEFDVPVRFDVDQLDVTLDMERLGTISSIPLIEVKR